MDLFMAWVILLVASIIEPIWVTCLDKSENFKKKGWGIAAIVLARRSSWVNTASTRKRRLPTG